MERSNNKAVEKCVFVILNSFQGLIRPWFYGMLEQVQHDRL